MNADELRSLQTPLKAQYREHPKTALVTLRAEGRIGENLTCKIETGKARVEAGLHPATGGDGGSACSADMLLEALVGCLSVTSSQREPLRKMSRNPTQKTSKRRRNMASNPPNNGSTKSQAKVSVSFMPQTPRQPNVSIAKRTAWWPRN